MSHKLRQRRKNKQKEKAKSGDGAREKVAVKTQQENDSVKILFRYALGGLALFLLRHASHYIVLKRPDLINNVFPNTLRPAVGFFNERQVLIVGTMSSGTSQVAVDLAAKLGLEIGHEVTDALDNFVRDGTSSWFHGIRFFPFNDEQLRKQIISDLCYNFTEKMGFHPRQYHEVPGCSEKKPWYPLSECWREDCLDILDKELGCAATTTQCYDTQPFYRTLLQVRDPRSTVESLVAKFCKDDRDQVTVDGTMEGDWIQFHNHLFQGIHNFTHDSCIEAAVHYVIEYNNIMLEAMDNGWIHGIYRVETATPCSIAKAAGFLSLGEVVYKPNYGKVRSRCSGSSAGKKPLSSNTNRINKGRIRLDWSNYQGGKHGSLRPINDDSLEQAMRQLMIRLGYQPDSERIPQK